MTPEKRCPPGSGCGHSFPATPDYWHHDKTRVDGLCVYCKICKRGKSLEDSIRTRPYERVTNSTHFKCEAMQAVLSVLQCLKRQKVKGYRPVRRGIPGPRDWEPYYACIGGCQQGAEIKERIRGLL